jgi:type II secretory pathway pseudopilin PulG
MFIFLKKQNKGFTLVEALVAISILMVAIVTPMTIAQNGLSSAMYSKDQMTASFLAQDAIEYIKNKRDEIGVQKDPLAGKALGEWIGVSGYFATCFQANGCKIDTVNNNVSAFNNEKLVVSRDVTGFLYYGYSAGDTSKFTRQIFIKSPAVDLGNQDEAVIRVIVSWQNGGNIETVEIKNFIYNYWENL